MNQRIRAQQRYYAGAYQRPYGYQYRQWQPGYTLPSAYRHSRYAVDHRRYGLQAPPRGYEYRRVDNAVVLTAVATGLIGAVIVGLFNYDPSTRNGPVAAMRRGFFASAEPSAP